MKSVISILFILPLAFALNNTVFLFPEETDTSYVTITPKKPLDLKAFTLCMRLASELGANREIILFAYRTQDVDELNVWRERDNLFYLYFRSSSGGVSYSLPQLSIFHTHLCITWESSSGLVAFWVDGRRTLFKVYKPGHTVSPGGTVVLGQDPDSLLGGFDAGQSFVGEITDVNMWDWVLGEGEIKRLYRRCWMGSKGNVIDWDEVQYNKFGNVTEYVMRNATSVQPFQLKQGIAMLCSVN